VGAQVAIAGFFIHYVTEVKPSLTTADGSNLLAVAQALFAVGRFVASILMKWVRPRFILLGFMTGIIIFITASIPTTGDTAIAMLCMVLFFESCIFPTIFTLSVSPTLPPLYFQLFLTNASSVDSVATPSAVHLSSSPPSQAVPSSRPWSVQSWTQGTRELL
jgi:hypothetical protein